MAVFPSTNLSKKFIGTFFGFGPPYRLSLMCAMAKSGGRSGYAFSIIENGGTASDGYLIEDAYPLWNIFSNYSPGEWVTNRLGAGKFEFRLKRPYFDTSRYMFSHTYKYYGGFNNYNHDAIIPSVDNAYRSFTQGQNSGLIKDYSIGLEASLGEYDWKRANSNITHWQVRVMDGNNIIARSTPTPVGTGSNVFSVVFPLISTTAIKTYNYKARVHLGNGVNDFTDVGYIPAEGNISIEITAKRASVIINVVVSGQDSLFYDFIDNGTTGGAETYSYRATYDFYYSGTNPTDGKTLRRIDYKLVGVDGVVKKTLSVTSFLLNKESPTTLLQYTQSRPTQIFKVSTARFGATDYGDQIQATMYYE